MAARGRDADGCDARDGGADAGVVGVAGVAVVVGVAVVAGVAGVAAVAGALVSCWLLSRQLDAPGFWPRRRVTVTVRRTLHRTMLTCAIEQSLRASFFVFKGVASRWI